MDKDKLCKALVSNKITIEERTIKDYLGYDPLKLDAIKRPRIQLQLDHYGHEKLYVDGKAILEFFPIEFTSVVQGDSIKYVLTQKYKVLT